MSDSTYINFAIEWKVQGMPMCLFPIRIYAVKSIQFSLWPMIYSLHSNCTLHSSLNSSLHKVTFYAMQDVDHYFNVEKNNDFI